MELIKRHKGLAIVGGLALILFIIMFMIFARMLFSNNGSEYGKRLNGIVKIDKDETKKLLGEIKDREEVIDASVRTQGKIIYMTIIYQDNVSKDKAKEIASDTYKYYSEDVISYYDFEYFLTQNEMLDEEGNDKSYTIAGTKHPDNDYISWTKN
ncbi:MAG: hypothetical protein IJZ79_05000 [Bacilli bacterium]|nr:hypothetical protein [Bacilli bacterium]